LRLQERRHNVPHPLTSFVGREQDIAEIRHLLATRRLLTLIGAGGVGKTRLGLEVAAGLLDAYADGIWLIELAALADATLVPHSAAAILNVREESERPLLATLADALGGQRTLLILDNCEHLIDACAAFADALLRACPNVRILATSRQPLGLAGETTFRVPSLSLTARPAIRAVPASPDEVIPARVDAVPGFVEAPLPPPVGTNPPVARSAMMSDAVRLFVERGRAAVPDFALSERNLAAVEQICQRLDGIPLAIELAAARISVLSPVQIADRLGDRFSLLTGGSRTALPQHQTLLALVDWSHNLLDERERTLLRRLAVFRGGWTLEAAEAVCADAGLAADQILDLLSGLIAKSLILTVRHSDEVRYWFPESIRAYAIEKLREAGEAPLLRERHGTWVLALAEQATPELFGPRQDAWLDRLDAEHDNLRAALEWSLATPTTDELAIRLVGALAWFWGSRGHVTEGRRWLERVRAQSAGRTPEYLRACYGAGWLAHLQQDEPSARHLLEEALPLARELDDTWATA